MITVITKESFVIHLNEQVVKEIYYAVKEANESGQPIGAITVTSPDDPHSFEITLGESTKSLGFRTTDKILYSLSTEEGDSDR